MLSVSQHRRAFKPSAAHRQGTNCPRVSGGQEDSAQEEPRQPRAWESSNDNKKESRRSGIAYTIQILRRASTVHAYLYPVLTTTPRGES